MRQLDNQIKITRYLSVFLLLWIVAPALASNDKFQQSPKAGQLSRLIELARDQFSPFAESRVGYAKERVLKRLASTEKWLEKNPKVKNEWRAYFNLDELHAQLNMVEPDRARLRILVSRFYATKEGLEAEKFIELREALSDYLDAVEIIAIEDLEGRYQTALDRLERLLNYYGSTNNPLAAELIAVELDWLDKAELGGRLVSAFRRHYGQPNFLVRVSKRVLAAGTSIPSEVKNKQVVGATILGTYTEGEATTKATVKTDLIPNPNRGEIRLSLKGKSVSPSNVGWNGPATIYSSSETDLTGQKTITIDAEGVHSTKAQASARTRTSINDIQINAGIGWRIINRIAWNKAYSSKSRAEGIAAGIAAGKFADTVENQAKEPLANVEKQYRTQFTDKLDRIGYFPRSLNYSTSSDALFIKGILADVNELSTTTRVPSFKREHDFSSMNHETFFNNQTVQLLFGGENHKKDEDFEKMMHFLTGRVPRPLRVYAGSDRWAVVLKKHPIYMKFDDGQLTMTTRLENLRWKRGSSGPVSVSADYEPEITRFGPRFNRVGEIRLKARQKLTEETEAFVKDKFNGLYGESVRFDGLIAPPGGAFEWISQLRLYEIYCDNGWIGIGYDFYEEKEKAKSK